MRRAVTHAIKVGSLYHPARRTWDEGAEYNCRGGWHWLHLFLAGPSAAEVAAVASGEVALALYVQQPAIYLCHAFGPGDDTLPWSAAPFSIHLVPQHERVLPPAEEQAVMRVVLIDARTGIVRALRAFLLAPAFTGALHAAIREQAAAPFSERSYDHDVARVMHEIHAEKMALAASHMTRIPRKVPRPEA